VDFFIFWPNKIHISRTGVVSSLSPPWCHISSDQYHHDAAPCNASFLWSQDKLTTSALSFGNASSRHLPSRAKTEAMNPHHHRRPPSPDRPTPTLHCYKKGHLNLDHSPTTQPHLYFVSFLARAPHHRSSTRYRHCLSPMSLRTMTPMVTN
jgi:hypothetical protein